MEHNTNRILWTVLVLAISVALYVIFKPAANGLLGQTTEKIQTVVTNIHGDTNDSSSSSSSNDTNVEPNLYTDTQNFDNPAAWALSSYNSWTKTTDTYKGLAVMQTKGDWGGLGQFIQVKKGDVLTYSVYARYTSGTGTSNIGWTFVNLPNVSYGHATVNITSVPGTITDSWQRVSSTAVVTSDGYVLPRLERGTGNTNTLQIAGIKVEKGDKATPYTP